MGWSWRIGRILGIDVYLHFTFLLLLAFFGFSFYQKGGLTGALWGLVFLCALFSIIVLHELGHALAARRYGIPTRDITLLPIGGVARLERMPDDPKQELVVALAGPLVNVVIAAGLWLGLMLSQSLHLDYDLLLRPDGMILHQLLAINIVLVVFNMLPAFPMDGGRVLRALLAMRIEYTRATQIAATVGQAFAVLFGLAGLFSGNFLLLFVALFVWMGAEGEASLVRMRSALAGIPIQRAMQTQFRVVPPEARLGDVLAAIAAGYQRDFPVLDASDRLVGVLTRDNIMQALAERNFDGLVADVMETAFVTAHPREMLQSVLARCEATPCHVVPVVDHGKLVGLVSADRLGEFLMLDAALRSHRHA